MDLVVMVNAATGPSKKHKRVGLALPLHEYL
jgi:hypothetical protein